MFRTHLPAQAVFRSFFTPPPKDIEDRIDAGPCYIGLGDQFDDDRRLVRAVERVPLGAASQSGLLARKHKPTDG